MGKLGERKAIMTHMAPHGSRMRLEFFIPARGLFGYRNEFMTDTKGEGILNTVFYEYQEYKGDIPTRNTGSLVAYEAGIATAYGIFGAQDRGLMFIDPGTEVYEGMIIGQNPKGDDMAVNVCRKKQMTNMRASGSDEALRLVPPKRMSLEQCIEFMAPDELLEVTPKNLRLRKQILSGSERLKLASKNKNK